MPQLTALRSTEAMWNTAMRDRHGAEWDSQKGADCQDTCPAHGQLHRNQFRCPVPGTCLTRVHKKKDTPDDLTHPGCPEERRLPTLPPGLAVPSAMAGLASLFGMGRGGSPPL